VPGAETPGASAKAQLREKWEPIRWWSAREADVRRSAVVLMLIAPLAVAAQVRAASLSPDQPGTLATPVAVNGLHRERQGELTIIHLEGAPAQFRSFLLEEPLRLVVDLYGATSRLPSPRQELVDRNVSQIQVSQLQTSPVPVVRVVFDLWRKTPVEVIPGERGLRITFGRGALPMVASTAPTPVGGQSTSPESPAPAPTSQAQAQPPPTAPPLAAPPGPTTVFSGEERLSLYTVDVRGNRGLSLLNEGNHFVQELDLSLRHRLGEHDTLEGTLSARYTDDTRVDPENFALQRFSLKLSGKDYEAVAGDFLTTFTPFTLAVPLRGVSGWKEFALLKGLRVTGVAGLFKGRWEELWDTLPNESFDRWIEGIRLEQRFTDRISVGVNFLNARDDASSIPRARAFTTPLSNQVVSLDARVNVARWLYVEGEAAHSWNDPNTGAPGGRREDGAFQLSARSRIGDLRATGRYMRVEPNFASAGSFTFADQEEVLAKADYDLFRQVSVGASFTRSRDNLDGQKATTTTLTTPEVRLGLHDLPGLGPLGIDLRHRIREGQSDDDLLDQVTRTSSVDLFHQLGPVRASGGYEHQAKEDFTDPARNARVDLVFLSADARFPLWGMDVAPLLRLEWFSEKRLRARQRETTRTGEAGVRVDLPRWAILEVNYRLSDTSAFLSTEDLTRQAVKVELRYRVLGRDDRLLTVSYEVRQNDFADNSRDYDEIIGTARMLFRF